MAEYRRFVAYIYEYQKGKKAANCGFVQVEARGNMCRMEFHIRCRGLVPGIGCEIYAFVRKNEVTEGSLLGKCTTETDKIEYTLETDTDNMGDAEVALDEAAGLILLTENGGFFGTEWDDRPIIPDNFNPSKQIISDNEELGPELSEAEHEKTGDQSEKRDEEASEKKEHDAAESDAEASKELHAQSLESQARVLPGTTFEPFGDGELTDCRKITPDDLHCLGRKFCMLRNNRFLQYGYYNFGHLLLCRNSRGQYLLGIPGGYDQQERFMAGMFGFPYFKESRQIALPAGKGGYWYRSVDSTNLH